MSRARGSKQGKCVIKCPIYLTLSFCCVYMCKDHQTRISLTLKRVLGPFFATLSEQEEFCVDQIN